ncbi:hypothetical protein EKG39_09960 [Shewanella atlantica]|uniref:Uncharacterized protein n=1 Tax=Shewanella atlantica TaxID=271099 RepID=A0A431WC98_9GAMM|nr:hypothetical protein EKG39_09960 [Shewanella atlantica]
MSFDNCPQCSPLQYRESLA